MCHSTDARTADDLSFQVHGNESQSLGEVEHDLFNSRSLNPRGSLSPSCVNKELSECIISPAFVIGSCRRGGADTPVKGVVFNCTLNHCWLPAAWGGACTVHLRLLQTWRLLHLCTNVSRVSSSLVGQRKFKYEHMNLFICLRMNESTGASHLNSCLDTLFVSLPEESWWFIVWDGELCRSGWAERFTSVISTAASCMETNSPYAKVWGI